MHIFLLWEIIRALGLARVILGEMEKGKKKSGNKIIFSCVWLWDKIWEKTSEALVFSLQAHQYAIHQNQEKIREKRRNKKFHPFVPPFGNICLILLLFLVELLSSFSINSHLFVFVYSPVLAFFPLNFFN